MEAATRPATDARTSQRQDLDTLFRRLSAPPVLVLVGMLLVWSATFIRLARARHGEYGTFGFDLGIFDQAVWLTSRLQDPFITVRGLDTWGHHNNLVFVLFAPFYWLGAGPVFLLVVQVVSQALGAVAVYLLARERVGGAWMAVGLAAVLLLNPTYQWLIWEFFHPEAFAIGPLLFAYWAARTRRWRWFWPTALLAISCKEDVALTIVVLGLLVVFWGDRRIGASIAALGAAWFAVSTRVLIPQFNEGGRAFYNDFFRSELGDSLGDVVANTFRHPTRTLRFLADEEHRTWYWKMLAPFAMLPLVAPSAFLIAVPMVLVNGLTGFPYTRDFRFHYSALVVAGGIVATVEAVAIVAARDRGRRGFVMGFLLATALATSVVWGPSPIGIAYDDGFWPLEHSTRADDKAAALALIDDDDAVSATYNMVPHLTHRERVYEFPVPWCNINWAVSGEGLHDPEEVDWIVVDRFAQGDRDNELFDRLVLREFTVRFEHDGVVAAERAQPASPPWGPADEPGACREQPGVDASTPAG
jgi:uncharacterized membrane protein